MQWRVIIIIVCKRITEEDERQIQQYCIFAKYTIRFCIENIKDVVWMKQDEAPFG